MSRNAKWFISLIILNLTIGTVNAITLSCAIKGYEDSMSDARRIIQEQITVQIEEVPYLYIEGLGSDMAGFTFADSKQLNFKSVNQSTNDTWKLINEGTYSNGTKFVREIAISRLTGLIAYTNSFGSIVRSYSGKCTKINASDRKF
jgi:hypothetical protein